MNTTARQKLPFVLMAFCMSLLSQANTTSPPASTPSLDPETTLLRLKSTVDGLHSYTVTHLQQERFGNEMGPKMKMKVKYSDGSLYVKMLEGPKKDAEVIYIPGKNDGKVRVHPGSFPDISLNLDPHGSRMMKEQHHPIEHLSFQHIVSSLAETAQRCRYFPGAGAKFLESENSARLNLELRSPWKEKKDKVKENEDIWSFSKRVASDPFLIIHSNSMTDLDDVSEGMELKIPLCYATKTLLTLNSNTYLPERLEMYDAKGEVYERYEWQDLDTKTILTQKDFDPKNKEYNF